jgi:hypothetical protein
MKAAMRLNTRFAPLLTALLLTACPDPEKRFDDFQNNVVDASEEVSIDAAPLPELPDLNGTFYVVYDPRPALGLDDPVYIHSLQDVTMTKNPDGTAVLDFQVTWLNANSRVIVPGEKFELKGVPVSNAGEFSATYIGIPMPAAANPITGTNFTMDLTLRTQIKSANLFCGKVDPGITHPSGVSLTKSTFAGQRVAPGTDGMNLPELLAECPPDLPDAGPIDAALPDADTTPDAGPPDAGLPDAT